MSALPPKADIGTQPRDVRFVPIADIQKLRAPDRGPVVVPWTECSTQYSLTEVLVEGAGFAQLRAA